MATKYNAPDFIEDDPIQFPHKYKHSQVDAEISAILTSAISFGNRKQIIKTAKVIDDAFAGDPLGFIREREYLQLFKYGKKFYRMIDGIDMRRMCNRLYTILVAHGNETVEGDFHENACVYKAIFKKSRQPFWYRMDFRSISLCNGKFLRHISFKTNQHAFKMDDTK